MLTNKGESSKRNKERASEDNKNNNQNVVSINRSSETMSHCNQDGTVCFAFRGKTALRIPVSAITKVEFKLWRLMSSCLIYATLQSSRLPFLASNLNLPECCFVL